MAALLAGKADRNDREVSTRSLFRLFLDLADRTPTRAEVAALIPLSHDERWLRVVELADREGATLDSSALRGNFERLTGRVPSAAELDALMARGRGSAERAALEIVGSGLYGSKRHRRARTIRQRARSIWVDLLDTIPEDKDAALITEALEDEKTALDDVVRLFAYSDKSKSGPGNAELDPWIDAVWLRMKLRMPTDAEKAKAREQIGRSPDGWRHLMKDLAVSSDYALY